MIRSQTTGPSRRTVLFGTGAIVAAAALPRFAMAQSTPVVETLSGPVQGVSEGGVSRYLGLRYAQPISGANRFAPPKPVEPWTETFVADRFADSAPQASGILGGSPVTPGFEEPDYVQPGEDCLALNIWAPDTATEALPVMVWLHGGGWQSGSGAEGVYNGTNLASRGDVIVVTINHRLGAHGLSDFSRLLGGDFADSDNLSVKDMVAALEWVRDNIAAFGGDPETVTIFGESGGGWKVNSLLGTPAAKGLFHRAIVQSGPLTRFHTPEDADRVAALVLEALGVTADNPEALNEVTMEEVLAAEGAAMQQMPMSMSAPGFPTGFWPVIDGTYLTRHPYDPDTSETGADVPLLLGQTGTEFTLFMLQDTAAFSLDDAALEQRVTATFGEDNAPWLLETYRADFPDYDPSGLWFRMFSDYSMGALSNEVLDVRATSGAAPVFAYRFDWMTPIDGGRLYSPHTIEIPFVFDNADWEYGARMTGGGDAAAALGATVSEAWVTFAKTGQPAAPGLPDWPQYDTESRAAMHLNTTSTVGTYIDPRAVDLFRGLLFANANRD